MGCFKPVETYVRDIPEDGNLLARATGQEVDEVVPVKFRLPLSPYAATMEEGKSFSLDNLRDKFEKLKRKYEVVLVEGAGGVAVPIDRNYTYADLARDWDLEVIIVGRAGLGTLNHTYLSYFYARSMGLKIRAIVLNGFSGEDVSERTNTIVVEEMTGIKPIQIPRVVGLLLPADERRKLLELVGF